MRKFLLTFLAMICAPPVSAKEQLSGRGEVNWRYGDQRSIIMTEFWLPVFQEQEYDNVLYLDLRLMGDDHENREGNLGLGYRQIVSAGTVEGVAGVNGWLDRRKTALGSTFYQATGGLEWLGKASDFRMNGYWPLSDSKEHVTVSERPRSVIAGNGILVDTQGLVREEPQYGFDLELGRELGQDFSFIENNADSFRFYIGGYYFNGDHTPTVAGWRARFAADITENIQIGGRLQSDAERGSQGLLEATFRFPFGNKKSYRAKGLLARLDESPERDIDIVTGTAVLDSGELVPVINKTTGQPQQVIIVDNTAGPGGNGSTEHPYNTLAAAQAAAGNNDIIYLKKGDGTDLGQNQGIVLDKQGVQLIGSGSEFIYDSECPSGNKLIQRNRL